MNDWLWPHLTADETERVAACLAEFRAPRPNRGQLTTFADDPELQKLEKRFLPQSPIQLVEKSLIGRVLVSTVGFRPLPVILTTLMIRPSKLYLLHSQDSRPMAEKVRDDPFVKSLGLHPVRDIILRSVDLVDAPFNYGRLRDIIEENPSKEFVIDISGGVKVMGISLATAAFWLRLPVIYLLGTEVMGIIEPFSERLSSLENPFTYFGSPDIDSLVYLFNQSDYDAALAVCVNLRETIGDVRTLGKLDVLAEFITLFRDWDMFVHSVAADTPDRKLASRLAQVLQKMDRLGLSFANRACLEDNLRFLMNLEQTWKPKLRNNAELHRLIDIIAGARRRAAAGKYDDAAARLYRSLEMGASIALAEHCRIGDAAKPDFAYFDHLFGSPAATAGQFRELAAYEMPRERLGLKDQMVLLRLSEVPQLHTVFYIYRSMEGDGLMEIRNRSTLAHGTIPVDAESYRRFECKVSNIIGRIVGLDRLNDLLAQATHPVLIL